MIAISSTGPKPRAMSAKNCARVKSRKTVTIEAAKAEIAEIANACPALPLRAIWYPSNVETTEEASPGVAMRMAVIVAPYCEP